MKKIIAILLCVFMLTPTISGALSFAQGTELSEAMLRAEKELFGFHTVKSAAYLRDCYNKAVAGADILADELNAAVDALVSVADYTRAPLRGFGTLTAEELSQMEHIVGEASQQEGFVTLKGEGKLRYSNAAENGIVGESPFAMETVACDGFVLKITADSAATLRLEVGKRGSLENSLFVIGDIAISEGEKVYFFDFDLFGELPLDGTLNYISLTFEGASEVTFGDLHAANITETATEKEYAENKFTSVGFDAENYYKLLQKGTNLALTMLDEEGADGRFVFAESLPEDDRQQWQIVRDSVDQSSFRVINKKYGVALHSDGSSEITATVPTLTDEKEEWKFSFSPARGYSMYRAGEERISYLGSRLRVTGYSSPVKYFDIYEIEGERWNQVWSDEFTFLDTDVWNLYDDKHRADTEPFYSNPANVSVEDGNLVITTKIEEYKGYPATSGWMTTEGNLFINYGRIEMSAKLPEGHKIWPAFWLMGDNDTWPYCGEIDIMEMVGGGAHNEWRGEKQSIATIHFADDAGIHAESGGWQNYLTNDDKLSEDYHIYALEWEDDQLRWYFDDVLYFTFNVTTEYQKHALSNNPMFILLDTSISGPGNNELPEFVPEESHYYIDYVRYYRENTVSAPEAAIPSEGIVTNEKLSDDIWSPTVNANASTTVGDTYIYTNYAAKLHVYDMSDMSSRNTTLHGSSWSLTNAISADGSRVVSGHTKGDIISVDLESKGLEYIKASTGYRHNVVAVNADGSRIYTAPAISGYSSSSGSTCYFRVYDAETLDVLYTEEKASKTRMITVADNGTYAFLDYDGFLKVRSAENENLGDYMLDAYGVDMKFSSDGKTLYIIDLVGKVYSLDIEAKKLSVIYALCPDEAYKLTLSNDGKYLAVAYADSCARVFDTETGRLVSRPTYNNFAVMAVAFSPDGKLFAMAGNGGRIVICDTETWLPVAVLEDSKKSTACFDNVAFSDNGRNVFSSIQKFSFESRVLGWELPENILHSGADFSALEELGYVDETLYTEGSYAAYGDALANAFAVRANRYSSQSEIDLAAQTLAQAKAELKDKPDVIKGDADGDGIISVSDALYTLRIAARLAESTPDDLLVIDIDGDGSVSVADALAILRVAAKLSESL